MSEPDEDRIQHRAADLLPEELVVGSDDPQEEARILLEDSDRRTEEAEGTDI